MFYINSIFDIRLILISFNITNCYNQALKIQKYRLHRAVAAQRVIKYILSLPAIEHFPHHSKSNQRVSNSINNNVLSTNIIKALNNTYITDKQKQEKLSNEVIRQFEQMFDPKIGVVLPQHFKTQKRIKDGMNIQKINKQQVQSQQKYSKNIRKQNIQFFYKPFSFFPNRLSTVQVFKILDTFQDKTLFYGAPGIAKTTSIIFYCYLSSMITEYQFEYNHSIALDISRIFYLNYQTFKQQEFWNKKQLEPYLYFNREYLNQQIRSQCPQNLKLQLLQSSDNMETSSLKYNYNKIRKAFKDRKTRLKIVFDQFNSYVAEIRDFNSTVLDKNIKLTQQQKVSRQKIIGDKYFWIFMSNKMCNNDILYSSSQNIEQNILDRISNGNYIGLDLNHHSNITISNINYYKNLKFVEGRKQILRILFFKIKKCGKIQLKDNINQIQKIYFENDDFYFENECNLEMTHYDIHQFFTQSTYSQNVENIFAKIQNRNNNPNKKENRQNVNKLVSQIILQLEVLILSLIKSKTIIFSNAGNFTFQKYWFLRTVKGIIYKRLNTKVQKKRKENSVNIQLYIFTKEQLVEYGFTDDLTQELIDKNLFQFDSQSQFRLIKCKFTNSRFLKIVDFLDHHFIQKIINQQSFFNLYVDKINRYKNYFLIDKQFKSLIRFLTQNYNLIINLSNIHLFNINFLSGGYSYFQDEIINISQKIEEQINEKEQNIKVNSFEATILNQNLQISNKKNAAKIRIREAFQNYYGKMLKKDYAEPKIIQWNHYIVSACKGQRKTQQFFVQIPFKRKFKAKCQIVYKKLQDLNIYFTSQDETEKRQISRLTRLIDEFKRIK